MKGRWWKLFSKTIVGGKENPLMIRWIIFRTPWLGLYVHKFLRSDYDRALHDHPWPFVALVVKGGYIEEHDQTITGERTQEIRNPGDVLVRPAEWRHRVILKNDNQPSWSVCLVGARQRRWGFFTPKGWCHWRRFDSARNADAGYDLYEGGED